MSGLSELLAPRATAHAQSARRQSIEPSGYPILSCAGNGFFPRRSCFYLWRRSSHPDGVAPLTSHSGVRCEAMPFDHAKVLDHRTGPAVHTRKHAPRVSIGVPVYNGARYLAEALESLLRQTYEDIEIIVSDNASTDATEEIARSFAARDSRVRYDRLPNNIGAAANFMRVLHLARGEYFRWAAADDLSAPEFVERCVAILDREPAVVQAYPRAKLIDERGAVIGEYQDNLHIVAERASDRYIQVLERIGLCNAIYGVMRTSVLRRMPPMGAFEGSDIPWQAEIALHGKIWEIPEYLFFRRRHRDALSIVSTEARQVHYDPSGAGKPVMRNWRHAGARLGTIVRGPGDLWDRARLLAFLARDVVWSRDEFAREIGAYARYVFSRGRRPDHRRA